MRKILFPVLPAVIIVFAVFFLFRGNFLHAASPSEQTLPLDPSLYPDTVTVDSLHHRAYVASHTSVDSIPMPVTVVDTLHDSVAGVLPVSTLRAIAVNPTAHRLYIGDSTTGNISIFDTDTNTAVGTISSLLTPALSLSVNQTTNRVFTLTNKNTQTLQTGILTVFDGDKQTVLADNIAVGNNPKAVFVNELNNKIYVVSADNDPGLTVVDGATNTVIAALPVALNLNDIAVDTVLNKIYLTTKQGDVIYTVDGNSNTLSSQITLTGDVNCAGNLAVDQIAHKLYASCFNGLTIIDTKTNAVVQQVPLTGELPVTKSINSGYFGLDEVLDKLYVPLEETHQLAIVSLTDPPRINPVSHITANEGDNVTIPFSFTDNNFSFWKVNADFGDGSNKTLSTATSSGSFQHVFADNGSYTLTLTVTNSEGAASSITVPVTVNNVSPTVGEVVADKYAGEINNPINFHSSFTDPGLHDTHNVGWDFGDGTKAPGTISGLNVAGSHLYSKPGIYTVLLTVTDKDNAGTTNRFEYVAVNDAKAQSVTAAGVIDSPKGAYRTNPDITGKTEIGISVKNTFDHANATGSAEYKFLPGNLDFKAATITSVVTNGENAQVKGVGEINGTGNFAFILSLQNNSLTKTADTIRLKIWDISSGSVVYDTQLNDSESADPITALENGGMIIN